MKKYLLTLLVVFTLFACDPFKDLPTGATLTDQIKFYQKGTEVSADLFIQEVILSGDYIRFSSGDLSKVSFEITSPIDTTTVGKKKITFKMTTKEKGYTELYCYIFVYEVSTQEFPITPTTPLVSIGLPPSPITVGADKLSYTLEPTLEPENTNQRDLLFVSKNPEIATVDIDGTVTRTPDTSGNVEIVITSYYNPAISATVTLSFDPYAPVITAVSFSSASIRSTESSIDLNSLLVLEPATTLDREFTWETSNDKIAIVDGGVVTRVAGGKVTIKAISTKKSDVFATIDVSFTILADQVARLSGFPSHSGWNKNYNLILAIDFENDTMPDGVEAFDHGSFEGYLTSLSNKVSVAIQKAKIQDWRYIELGLICPDNSMNLWMRSERNVDTGPSNRPIAILKNLKWGPLSSGFNFISEYNSDFKGDGTFQRVGILIEGNYGYEVYNRFKPSNPFQYADFTRFYQHYSNSAYPRLRIWSEPSNLLIDYVAFYQ